jgi:hypothetical protein
MRVHCLLEVFAALSFSFDASARNRTHSERDSRSCLLTQDHEPRSFIILSLTGPQHVAHVNGCFGCRLRSAGLAHGAHQWKYGYANHP